MIEIVIFMLIFALAMSISRLGHATLFSRFLTAPFFGFCGVFLSQNGLGVLRAPMLMKLDLFTQIALVWLAFLLGLKLRNNVLRRTATVARARALAALVFTYLATVALVFLAVSLIPFTEALRREGALFSLIVVMSSALLIGHVPLFGRGIRVTIFSRTLIALVATTPLLIFFYQSKSDDWFHILLPFLVVFISAGFCFVIYRLMISPLSAAMETVVLILAANCALLAGVAIWFFVPHILLGFAFGVFFSCDKTCEKFLPHLYISEQPMRILLMILIGAHLTITFDSIVCGLFLGIIIYTTRLIIHLVTRNYGRNRAVFSPFMGASELSAILLASLMFVFPEHRSIMNDVLLFILVAASVGDVLGVARWSMVLRTRRHNSSDLLPSSEL